LPSERYGLYDHGCQTGIAISAKEGISMKNNELVVSLMFGTMATFVVVLVWGRRLVDLLPIWPYGG